MQKAILGATLLALGLVNGAPAEALVPELPEMGTFKFKMYSGYMVVSEKKQLHYMFAES